VLVELGLTEGQYILSVGTLEPRKNLERLISAFELFAFDSRMRLVLAGARGWHYMPILRRVARSPLRDRITLPGYLPPEAIAALTRSSAVSAYVSLYEGFGMPIIDAMCFGTAVVTSNRTSMPEAAGGAAVLVNPFDIHDIARGLREAIATRPKLIEAGRRRIAGRTWTDVAREHLDVYRWGARPG
jgi:alpha-1,3-rhamnosyl/mannosyltransferase